MPTITPTVGRIVYYKAPASADGTFPAIDRAAIITEVQPEPNNTIVPVVRLCVFHPFGFQFTEWVPQGQGDGSWDWMPFQKDQAARMAPGTLDASHPATGAEPSGS